MTIDATANDQNPAGGALSLSVASQPLMGEVTVKDGAFATTPTGTPAAWTPSTTGSPTVNGKSSTATDIVKVDCVNDAPVAVNDRVRMPKGENTLRLLAPGPARQRHRRRARGPGRQAAGQARFGRVQARCRRGAAAEAARGPGTDEATSSCATGPATRRAPAASASSRSCCASDCEGSSVTAVLAHPLGPRSCSRRQPSGAAGLPPQSGRGLAAPSPANWAADPGCRAGSHLGRAVRCP